MSEEALLYYNMLKG